MENILLRTKLYIPSLRPNLVARPHLTTKLDEGSLIKLILISAPAGYGKTTLITEWIAKNHAKSAVCWFSLDPDDNDPQQFFSYLAAATKPLLDTPSQLAKRLQSPQSLPAKNLMVPFVSDMVSTTAPFLLVLDDYHVIESVELDKAVAYLLDHMPPHMTLAITSRTDPGFPISRLRSQGALLELRADDLRFKEAEAAQFLQKSMGLTLSTRQVSALETRTEGWIAGLKMAALSLQSQDDVDRFVDNFTGSHRFIMDYLTDEVLAQSPPNLQAFLLQTAVLSRLNADLCAAVLEISPNSSQQMLDQLHRHNIFLIPLDDERHWYRYHHLFAELLRQKGSKSTTQSAYRKAAEWSKQNNMVAEAISYSLAAADYDIAAPLLIKHALSFLFQNKLTLLRRWLDAFPRDYLPHQPMLSVYYGWVLLNQGEIGQIEHYLKMAEEGSQAAPLVRTITAIIRSSVAREQEDFDTIYTEAKLALKLASPDNLMARCAALAQLGSVQMMTGDINSAIKTLIEAVDSAQKCQNLNALFLSGGFLGLAYLLQNRPETAEQVVQETLTTASKLDLLDSPLLSYVHLALSQLLFLKQDFNGARAKVQEAMTQYQLNNELVGFRWGALQLANIELATEQFEAADQAFKLAYQTAQTLSNPHVLQQMAQLKNCMAQRNLGDGLNWIITRAPTPSKTVSPPSTPSTLVEALGGREKEILTLIRDGRKNKEIAAELFISINTVHYHTKNIYSKLAVNTRIQAVAKARELNLL